MTVYIGVDFHPYEQSVAYASDEDGEIGYRRFLHSDKQSIRAFYRKCGADAVIGVEATGCLWWFEKLLAGGGHQLKIGDPRMIRRAALSRHKNDFRDAETILDLLMRGAFPSIVPRSEESREVLDLLHYRQTLEEIETWGQASDLALQLCRHSSTIRATRLPTSLFSRILARPASFRRLIAALLMPALSESCFKLAPI